MSKRRTTPVSLLALAAVLALLAGCAGVPSSSKPEVIGPVVGGPASDTPSIRPAVNTDPNRLVADFLTANATDDPSHAAARLFLTPDARSRWSGTTATVLSSYQVSVFDSTASTVTVTGDEVGSIDANGIYKPSLAGDGNGGQTVKFQFTIGTSGGQWRIDQLKDGLVLNLSAFEAEYDQRAVYYLDQSEQRLVPDPRYTALGDSPDPTELLNWLAGELASGPSDNLATAVISELPAQIEPSVTIGDVVSVTMPGAAQLDGNTRYRLAGQVAATFAPITGSEPIRLLDAGRPLAIPHLANGQFSSSDFANTLFPVPPTAPALYYIDNGAVRDAKGVALSGYLGSGGYGLSSVAVAPRGADDLYVAGVAGSGDQQRLLLGTRSQGLQQVPGLTGDLTRPSWAPRYGEAWVAAGSTVYRAVNGVATKVQVPPTVGSQPLPVIALRISPDGSRIAMVLAGANDTAQLWIGSIVRTSGQVRIDSLTAISPVGVALVDVSWNDSLKLFVTGQSLSTNEANVFEVQVDGSLWTSRPLTNLPPGAPASITVAETANAWVSADGAVWTQQGTSWVSPSPGGQVVAGTNPVYIE